MKSPARIALWMMGTMFAVIVSLPFIGLLDLAIGTRGTEKTREIPAEELSHRLKHLSPNIRVADGFEASSYDGWHGDGGSITIYHIDPSGTDELIAGLKLFFEEKRKEWPQHYDYEWSEASRPNLSVAGRLIPKKFQPGPGIYTIARQINGYGTVSIERQAGYICFADARM